MEFSPKKIYPRTKDKETVYLKSFVKKPKYYCRRFYDI
jgi:hypothetical protein